MMLLTYLRHPVVLSSVLILVLSLATEGDGFSVSTVMAIASKLMKVATKGAGGLAGHTWNVVSFKTIETGWNGLLEAIFPKDDKVTDTMNEILNRFDEVEHLVTTTTIHTIEAVSSNLMRMSLLAPDFQQIDKFLSYLDHQMRRMHYYRTNNITNTIWKDFANSLVNNQQSVLNQMEKIYQLVTDSSTVLQKTFVNSLVEYYQLSKDNQRCERTTSPQQTFIEFFRKMYAAETKTYILVAFAYQVLTTLDQSKRYDQSKKYEHELELQTEYFVNRTSKFEAMMRKHADKLDRDYWVCNPSANPHTTFQMNKFIYGYMDLERDISGWCGQTCNDLKSERGLQALENESSRKCVGMVRNCRTTNSKTFKYCFAKNEESSYLYEYIENDLIKRGAKEMCASDINPLENKYAYINGIFKCDYCVCECVSEDEETHRFLSLLPQMSNIFENKVIIGVKFTKYESKLISLQIKEAPLQPYGYVDESKAEWRDLDPMLLPNTYWNYPGYYIMSGKERAMRMKKLEGPENTVMTGIKFIVKNDVPDISIRFTYFNFTSGVMQPEKSFWITETHDNPEPIDYNGMAEPAACATLFPDTKSGQKILFGHNGLGDAGSKVVPFFDSQPVVPDKPVALSGAGILHKGDQKQCAGLIAPVVTTLPEKYFVDSEIDSPNKQDPF